MNAKIFSCGLLLATLVGAAQGQDALEKQATWATPSAKRVKTDVEKSLKQVTLDELTRLKIDALWPAAEEGAGQQSADLLEQVVTTASLINDESRQLLMLCRGERTEPSATEFTFLKDEKTPVYFRHNLRLFYGRWLAQYELYDEALTQLKGIKPEDVADPASLLFYQSVCQHALLKKEECLPTLTKLLERENELPRRYATIAKLMRSDIRPLKTDSLDEVARIMSNIRRRLELGRAGKRVRKEEDDVIAKLEKMIKQKEEELRRRRQQQQANAINPSNPAEQSRNLGGSGEGNVDPKKISRKADWGNLPDKERQEALQPILEELPAHYRKAVEEYLRKLARDGVK